MGYDIEALPSFLRFLAYQLESIPWMQQRIEQIIQRRKRNERNM